MSRHAKHRAQTPARTRFAATAAALALSVPAAGLLTAAPATAAASDIVSVSSSTRANAAQDLLDLINAHRKAKGLSPVKYSATLSGVAQGQSDRLVREEVVNHTNTFMTDPRAAGWSHVGEIHALSYQTSVTELMNWWKGSKAHNKVLTDPNMQVIGIGLTYADGSLARTKQPWKLVGTVTSYGFPAGKAPADTSTRVSGSGGQVATPSIVVKGGIATSYRTLGGSNVFGTPTMNERGGLVAGGVYQQFSKGYIFYWSPASGTYPVKMTGAIGKKFAAARYENGYGYPTTTERTGLVGGGAYQVFRTPAGALHKVLWSPTTGAKVVKETGAIGKKWKAAGHERGYGFPTTDEYSYGSEVRQKFSNGYTVHWSKVTSKTWVTR